MAAPSEFRAHIEDLLAHAMNIRVRPMFGAAGIYADGTMFGILVGERVYLKADEASRSEFELEGCVPFVYSARDGRQLTMSYYSAPERFYDDADEAVAWARRAIAAAHRKLTKKPKSPRR